MFTLFTGALPVSGIHVPCDTPLTSNVVLDKNIICTGANGLVIGADRIMIDLNGFTVSSTTGSGFGVDNTGGFDHVTIHDGTINGFSQGIKATGVTDFNIKGVTFTGATSGADAHKIDIRGDKGVTITRVTITMGAGSPAFGEAIRLENIENVIVDNVIVHGGFVGVNFACLLCDGTEPSTDGVVKDSTLLHNFNGILIANSINADVLNNVIMDGVCVDVFFPGFCTVAFTKGINIDFLSNSGSRIVGNEIFNFAEGIRAQVGTHTNLKIESNYIHDNTLDGMRLQDVSDSRIFNNLVMNNGGKGISLESSSMDNKILKNRAHGNTLDDLIHDGTSTPNNWKNNSCDVESSADIPTC